MKKHKIEEGNVLMRQVYEMMTLVREMMGDIW